MYTILSLTTEMSRLPASGSTIITIVITIVITITITSYRYY